jgi:hypothetical protein
MHFIRTFSRIWKNQKINIILKENQKKEVSYSNSVGLFAVLQGKFHLDRFINQHQNLFNGNIKQLILIMIDL